MIGKQETVAGTKAPVRGEVLVVDSFVGNVLLVFVFVLPRAFFFFLSLVYFYQRIERIKNIGADKRIGSRKLRAFLFSSRIKLVCSGIFTCFLSLLPLFLCFLSLISLKPKHKVDIWVRT